MYLTIYIYITAWFFLVQDPVSAFGLPHMAERSWDCKKQWAFAGFISLREEPCILCGNHSAKNAFGIFDATTIEQRRLGKQSQQ